MLIAYHGNQTEKDAILKQLQKHYDADDIINGKYLEKGKGCAVGCTIYGNDHKSYEEKFGIPVALAKLEDCIFEGLPNKVAKKWPIDFMASINAGSDLSMVWPKFALWMVENMPKSKKENVNLVISNVIYLYRQWIENDISPSRKDWFNARAAAAYAAAYADDHSIFFTLCSKKLLELVSDCKGKI